MKKEATIYRMVTPDHLCPWGVKTKDLLRRSGYQVNDNHLETAEANEQYKKDNNVDETPQIWINGEYIGGYDELREHLLGEGNGASIAVVHQPLHLSSQ